MTEGPVSTLVPNATATPDVLESVSATTPTRVSSSDRLAVLESLAHDETGNANPAEPRAAKAFLTGLLWVGYATAILVALALVWSTGSGLLK